MKIVSIGEIIWDVIDTDEFLGGAPLNFSISAARLGHQVSLVSGVGDDDLGQRAITQLQEAGIDTACVSVRGGPPTGTAIVSLDDQGHASFEIPRPAAYDRLSREELPAQIDSDWVYFGTLFNSLPPNLETTLELLRRIPQAKRFYDVNLRTGHWHVAAVMELAAQAHVTKLNHDEVGILALDLWAEDVMTEEDFCRRWNEEFGCTNVCITRAERGCAIYCEGSFVEVKGFEVSVADTVGAGDAFAAAFLHGLNEGWTMEQVGKFANAAGALVASRAGATPEWTLDECLALSRSSAVGA